MIQGDSTQITVWGWNSYYSQESFNIAAPPDYSNTTDIIKHPVFSLEKKPRLTSDQFFAGWILIFYQYGLSKSSHSYYKDLNNQLDSEGRLFDPLYVQALSNISCINNKDKLVLGNFEISAKKEYRFFVIYLGTKSGYLIKPIPYFYDIPAHGKKEIYRPDFWEYSTKIYPDE